MRESRWIDERIRTLEREVAAEENGAAASGPDRRFLLGALHQRRGRPLEAARWYAAAARAARDPATARALVRLARELAPDSLDAAREARRLADSGRHGMNG